jgi:trans-aconitate 2-methyltransferase
LDWDAATYDRVSGPQEAWAQEQLARLPLQGDEVVLDAGCGSGRVTRMLIERVPRGRVYGVDAAPSMVAHSAQALGGPFIDRVLARSGTPLTLDYVRLNMTARRPS